MSAKIDNIVSGMYAVFRMPDPSVEVIKELEILFAEWEKIEDDLDFDAYCEKFGSDALHEYDKMCGEIRAQLQPGEYA